MLNPVAAFTSLNITWVHGSRRHLRNACTLGFALVLTLFGCANRIPAANAPRIQRAAIAVPSAEVPHTTRTDSKSEPPVLPRITTSDFSLPIPDGYDNLSAFLAKGTIIVALGARQGKLGYQSTISVIKAPIPGGSYADPTTCTQTGHGLIEGGTEAAGTGGTLKSAQVIDGPVGRGCQIHIVAPEGAALITELHLPHNTPSTPKDIWLLVCNHASGDLQAEATCRTTLMGFQFRLAR